MLCCEYAFNIENVFQLMIGVENFSIYYINRFSTQSDFQCKVDLPKKEKEK